jgi:E-phenylitaconyl-CoA hydratase
MPLLYAVQDGVAIVTLNRPEALNAIDPETRAELRDAWQRIAGDDAVRCVVLTGSGDKAFCTGSDLKKTMPPKESSAQLSFGGAAPSHLLAGMDFDKPLICAINGYAMGGGLELALACDIRLASENARFALSEVRLGSIPGAGGTQRLPRLVGQSDAMLLLLTGDRVDAAEALRIGLVSRVVPATQLMESAMEVARRIAQNAPLSVRAIKRLVRDGLEMPLDKGIQLESYAFGLLRDTEDRIEGRVAFQEKRPPVYRGR